MNALQGIICICIIFGTSINATTLIDFDRQKIESYDPCNYDSDCKPNAFCFGNDDKQQGKCKCKDGYELNRNKTYYECLKAANLGEPCEQDFQCQIQAGPMTLCNKYKICECNDLAHNYTDGKCYKTVNLTDYCLTDANCKLSNDKFVFCKDGQCSCNLNERPSPDLSRCLPSRNLGDECTSEDDCLLIPNAVCTEICTCSIDYAVSRDGKSCLKAATAFGEPCVENDQCSKYLKESVCVQGNCWCVQGYHGYGVECLRSAKPGEFCHSLGECVFVKELTDNVDCINGICVCTFGQINNQYGCKLENFAVCLQSNLLLSILCMSCIYLYLFLM